MDDIQNKDDTTNDSQMPSKEEIENGRQLAKEYFERQRTKGFEPAKMKRCPICGNSMEALDDRFPNLICMECSKKALDANGDNVEFFNYDGGGGLIAQHTQNDGHSYQDKIIDCIVAERKCQGVEFHMGGTGIVLI